MGIGMRIVSCAKVVPFGQLGTQSMACLLFVILSLGLCLQGGPAQAQTKGAATPSRLQVRGDQNYPPYEFVNDQGQADGYNVDMFRAVAKAMHLQAHIELGPWNQVRTELEQGTIDVLVGMFFSRERDEEVDFSDPHLIINHALFVREGSSAEMEPSLKNKEIIVQRADIMHDYVRSRDLGSKVVLVESQPEGLRLLASGRHDCFLGAEQQGMYILRKDDLENLVTVGGPFLATPYGFAVPEGREDLLRHLNQGLQKIKASGRYQAIYDKWFGAMKPQGLPWKGIIQYGALILVPLLLILGAVLLWTRTLRRKVQEKTAGLRKSEAFLSSLVDAVPIPVFWKDAEGVYIGCNNSFESFFNMREEDLRGKTVFDPNPSDLAATHAEKDKELLQQGGVQEYESQVRNAQGDERNVIMRKKVFHDSAGAVKGLIGAFLDITERRKMEQSFQQAQRMESIGNLAGGIAHDFNNILCPVLGMAELLMQDVDSQSQEYALLQDIHVAAKRGADLVQQILTFGRRTEQRKQPITIQPILEDVLKLCRSTIPADIHISRDISPEVGMVMADPTQIYQVVMNLVTNAYHALQPQGGSIHVGYTQERAAASRDDQAHFGAEASYALLTVADTGSGIDPEVMDTIFEPYFTTKEPGKGTGMGLAVVYAIIQDHGGRIRVQSQPGQGTTFEVLLPQLGEDHQQEEEVPTEPEQVQGHGQILVVDDEEAVVRIESLMLRRSGYQVTSCTNSLRALQIFTDDPDRFELVITDATMPEMSGEKLVARLLALRPELPIIMCTGYSDRVHRETAGDMGVAGFLMKPMQRSELINMVRKVLKADGKSHKGDSL